MNSKDLRKIVPQNKAASHSRYSKYELEQKSKTQIEKGITKLQGRHSNREGRMSGLGLQNSNIKNYYEINLATEPMSMSSQAK